MGILELSNHYVLPRLMALCELYISKEVERATSESINKADIDVIGRCVRVGVVWDVHMMGVGVTIGVVGVWYT